MKYDFLIVGCGLYGSVFANRAIKNGFSCLIIEKRSHIGGNIYTEKIDGITLHRYGAHIFHTSNKNVWSYVNKFAKFNRFVNSPLANYHGELYNLPFNMNTFNKLWGVVSPQEAKNKIMEQRKAYYTQSPSNLEEQAINLVGPEIYEKLIKEYTEKQWGCPCSKLPPFIIKRLPLRFTYDNNYFDDLYQGIPIGGYTQLVEKLIRGIDVELNTDYLLKRDYWDAQASCIVYTGSIDEFFDYAFGKLPYRSIYFETERLECENYQGNAVVNYTDRQTGHTRIIEHKHFEFGEQPHTIISREYSIQMKEGMEPFYPINNEANNALYTMYENRAHTLSNVKFGGRLGQYRYLDMDAVIAAAMESSSFVSLKAALMKTR
jgi:UDP-galactopyranose mutase